MFKPSISERIVHKIGDKTKRVLAPIRRRKLNNIDFTIISNNCWGGIAYEYYGLPKLSPTVGTYFYAEDYINFLENFKEYINKEIEIIHAKDSRHAEDMIAKGEGQIPVGKLDENVEVVFCIIKIQY